jgi:enoyl-CoA hydratase
MITRTYCRSEAMTIHEHVQNGVAELVLDNPPVNAFTIEDLQSLADHLDAFHKRPEVKVVVFRSVGRGFCGGGDVKQVQSLPGFAGILGQTHGSLAGSLAILDCAVPVITAVHNYCIGVGMLLAGTSDIVLASDGATFVFAEADNGATAGFVQGLGLLPEKRLRAAMLTCENIDAAEFVRYGYIYRVLPDEEQLVSEARRLAGVIAAKDPRVIRRMKATMNGTANRDLLRKYRGELSYTYELNLLGVASELRGDFVEGRRGSYTESPAAKPASS